MYAITERKASADASSHLETVTLSDAHDVNHLVLREHRLDGNLLLEKLVAVVDLVSDLASVDLDLHDVSLLLAEADLRHLGVSDDADNLAVLLDLVEGLLEVLGLVRLLLSVLGEGLLGLGLVPVLVEAATEFVTQVLSPDGGERAQSARSLHVANETNHNHGRGLDDSDSLDGLLLVGLGARLVHIANNVGHTSLVTQEGRKVARLGSIVPGELPDLAPVVRAPLAGKKSQRAVARALELPVRHGLLHNIITTVSTHIFSSLPAHPAEHCRKQTACHYQEGLTRAKEVFRQA
jgi:hypothetical protein